MLMGNDRKKVVSIIVGSLSPSYTSKDGGEMKGEYKTPDSEAEAAQVECAEELMAAVKDGDAKAFVKAFKDLCVLCDGEGDDLDLDEESA